MQQLCSCYSTAGQRWMQPVATACMRATLQHSGVIQRHCRCCSTEGRASKTAGRRAVRAAVREGHMDAALLLLHYEAGPPQFCVADGHVWPSMAREVPLPAAPRPASMEQVGPCRLNRALAFEAARNPHHTPQPAAACDWRSRADAGWAKEGGAVARTAAALYPGPMPCKSAGRSRTMV